MNSITTNIGEILPENKKPLLKMWDVSIEAGQRNFRKHAHTRFEIALVNAGTGEYTTKTSVYPIAPGDLFIFASNEIHCITKASEGGLCLTNLHFEPRYLINNHKNDSFINFCFSHAPAFQNRIPCQKAATLTRFFLAIREELQQESYGYLPSISACLDLFFVELLRHHSYSELSKKDMSGNAFPVLSVFSYIDEHLEDTLTLEALASVAGLSPNYFSHIFKKQNGISLWDYITAKRIERSIRLITSDNNLTMLEIAMKCGFNNTVNFNKAFKKQTGITPSSLKKDPKLLTN